MIVGRFAPGGTPTAVAANQKRVAPFDVVVEEVASKIEMYGDTIGATGPTRVRAVAYDNAGVLLGVGNEVIVPPGQAASWLTFPFTESTPEGVYLEEGRVYLGVHAGDAGLRVYEVAIPTAPTLSGNELTDTTRSVAADLPVTASGQMEDGKPATGWAGLWRAATNLFRHGQCDAATDWVAGTGVTTTVDLGLKAPFSPQSIKVVTDGLSVNQVQRADTATGLAAAAGTLGVGLVWLKGVEGQTYNVRMRWSNTDTSTTDGTATFVTATGGWQLVRAPAVAVAVGKTGDALRLRVEINGTRAETFWVAHAMIETGWDYSAPYVATSGATATHGGSNATVSAALMDEGQGWWAFRWRPGFDSAAAPAGLHVLGSWRDNANNLLELRWNATSGHLEMVRGAGGLVDVITDSGFGFTADLTLTITAAWLATDISVLFVDTVPTGAAFVTHIPTLSAGLMSIGRQSDVAQNYLDGDVLWFAYGTGDAVGDFGDLVSALRFFGDELPVVSMLPVSAQAKGSFPMGRVPNGVIFNTDTYSDGASNPFGASSNTSTSPVLYAPTYPGWAPATKGLEVVLGRLPFNEAQVAFRTTAPTNAPPKQARVAWHGTGLNAERGSFATAKLNGIFDPFVGERLLISYGTAPRREVVVYVNDLADIDQDLSLARRAFKALAPLGDDEITATVQVLA